MSSKVSYLNGTRCYLSSAIEMDTEANWRPAIVSHLAEKFGINVFDPFADPKQQWTKDLHEARKNCEYDRMANIAKKFVKKDLEMVLRSDFLLAYLPYRLATTGTHHEIIDAVNNKKPVILMCPQGKQFVPIWYYGFIPHNMMFGTWEEVYEYLGKVSDGEYKNKYDRWDFVYGLI